MEISNIFDKLLAKAEDFSPYRKSTINIVAFTGIFMFLVDSDVVYFQEVFEGMHDDFAGDIDRFCGISGKIYSVPDFENILLDFRPAPPKDPNLDAIDIDVISSSSKETSNTILPFITSTIDGQVSHLADVSLIVYLPEVFVAVNFIGSIVYQILFYFFISFVNLFIPFKTLRPARELIGMKVSVDLYEDNSNSNINSRSNTRIVYEDLILARIIALFVIYFLIQYSIFGTISSSNYATGVLAKLPTKLVCVLNILNQDKTYSNSVYFGVRRSSQTQGEVLIIFNLMLIYSIICEFLQCLIDINDSK